MALQGQMKQRKCPKETKKKNAHAELILKVEGLPENTLGVLRMKFNSLAEMVEREVRENTSLTT